MSQRMMAQWMRQLTHQNGRGEPVSDEVLLARFVQSQSENDFSMLVERHGPMVWGVCRNLLDSEADAEDAFQAVFLAFFRQAGKIRNRSNPGAWLHGASVRVCMKVRSQSARRKTKEHQAARQRLELSASADSDDWQEQLLTVHRIVKQLPTRERTVFVLCTLEGRGQAEVARQLKIKINSVSGILSRARKRIQSQLNKSHLASGLAIMMVGSASSGMPFSMMTACSRIPSTATFTPYIVSLSQTLVEIPMRKLAILAMVAMASLACFGFGLVPSLFAQDAKEKNVNDLRANYDDAKKVFESTSQSSAKSNFSFSETRWEYKHLSASTTTSVEQALNQLGDQGWEVCGITQQGTTMNLILKRPKGGSGSFSTTKNLHSLFFDPSYRTVEGVHLPNNSTNPDQKPIEVSGQLYLQGDKSELHIIRLKRADANAISGIIKQVFSVKELAVDAQSNSLIIRCSQDTPWSQITKLIEALDTENKESKSKGR